MIRVQSVTMKHRIHSLLACVLTIAALTAGPSASAQGLTPTEQSLINRISADSLRGHLSFLASDLLEGRATPSRGLDLAAEYIAAQFRRFGVEPIDDAGSFFQMSSVTVRERSMSDFRFVINAGPPPRDVPLSSVTLLFGGDTLNLTDVPLHWVDSSASADVLAVARGAVVVTELPDLMSLSAAELRDAVQSFRAFFERAHAVGVSAVVAADPHSAAGTGLEGESRQYRNLTSQLPYLRVHGEAATALRTAADAGARVTINFGPAHESTIPVRNVAGFVRGSDPALRESYVLITAHYDHIGRGRAVEGDDLYNGANDDASGTSSVLELARAFAAGAERPARSLLFLCFYGEESGMLGSRFYGENPIVPLRETIAMINLEHMGRTDDSEGLSERRLMPTGFDFSTLTDWFIDAGKETDVEVYHHPRNSASFFSRSDNIALAAHGITAHTFCTAFIFPDYHGAGDHWEKIDYDNMAAVNRTLALGLWRLANDEKKPAWKTEHRATGRYVEAWKQLHGEE